MSETVSSKTKILVASTNAKKLKELQELLAGLPLQLFGLKDFPDFEEVEETGRTFEENASLKALGYAGQTGMLTIGEDSGLCCDALEGAPGVYSARFAGLDKDDEANNRKLLKMLAQLPDNCRGAHYTSVIAIAVPGKILKIVRGEVHGVIHPEPRGSGGFGYDPIFYYPPFGKTFAEVSAEMKHQVSHRAKALSRAQEFFREYLQGLIQ